MTMNADPTSPNSDTVIWRYMDDCKFVRLLDTFSEHKRWCEPRHEMQFYFNDSGQLWFAYPWTFGDRLEGTLPDVNTNPEDYCDRMAALLNLSPGEAAKRKQYFLTTDTSTLQKCSLSMAQICGVSCWHASDAESEDMWEEFVTYKNGVAIKTTVGALEHSLAYAHNSHSSKAHPSVCAIGYVDHKKHFLPADGFRNLLGIIRSDYSYENEVRFIAKSPALAKVPTTITRPLPEEPAKWEQAFEPLTEDEKDRYFKECESQCAASYTRIRRDREKGFNLPVKLDGLIDDVVLKTGCTRDFRALVQQALQNAGMLNTRISESQL